jgi:predicted enzyme related to lactoylglutathione lyase
MAANQRIIATLPAVDINRAKVFYEKIFGCKATMEGPEPGAFMTCPAGEFYIYQRAPSKADHTLASILVDDIETEVRDLRQKGLKFEEYNMPAMGLKTDNGIATMGDIKAAWFKDSEGNILSLTQFTKTGRSPERGKPRER